MNISPKLNKRIQELIGNNNININVADLLVNTFNYTDIFDANEIKQYIKEGLSEKEAMMQIFTKAFDIGYELDENRDVMDAYILNNLKKLDAKEYLDNKYAKTIKATGKYKKYDLKYITYEPYQLFAYDDISLEGDKENSRIGYFDNKFSYLALTEGNNIWMSLNPNEIETMKPYINKAKCNVLVLGLGMGYVPFMMALKPEVKNITIIEKDPEIIGLFNCLILPSFKNKEKIRIIEDDAINYVRKQNKYDYIFADLWHSPEDGLALFVQLKRINKNIDCWLEESMYALLRRCMISLIEENTLGYGEENYKFAKTYTDRVINKYYQKTKNLTLNTDEDLNKLLDKNNLLSLLINN
ncbi:MAG: hypothetical protein J5666_03355 [Bacilli bacterium]|nr:hypothetical protein [Bacilli bacterium]